MIYFLEGIIHCAAFELELKKISVSFEEKIPILLRLQRIAVGINRQRFSA